MVTNLDTHYLAIELDRARLRERAERGWLIEQAAVSQQASTEPSPVRRRIGEAMIVLGRWMRGMPEGSKLATDRGPSR